MGTKGIGNKRYPIQKVPDTKRIREQKGTLLQTLLLKTLAFKHFKHFKRRVQVVCSLNIKFSLPVPLGRKRHTEGENPSSCVWFSIKN